MCLVAVLAAGCGPPSPGPVIQQLLDAYAPLLTIGDQLTPVARARYRLQYNAYVGYFDAAYEGLEDFRGVRIQVRPGPRDTKRGQPPPDAKISHVTLVAPNPAATARVDSRVRAILGEPTIACYTDGYGNQVQTRYWAGEHGRGILFRIWISVPQPRPALSSLSSSVLEPGWADVTFGADPALELSGTFEPCR
jgi:hypothetical protein